MRYLPRCPGSCNCSAGMVHVRFLLAVWYSLQSCCGRQLCPMGLQPSKMLGQEGIASSMCYAWLCVCCFSACLAILASAQQDVGSRGHESLLRSAVVSAHLDGAHRTLTAASHVVVFLQKRNNRRSQREKDNREAESMLTVAGPKGDTEWERTLDYVNFGFTRPNGSDLSRMKSLLFSAKAKNVPVKGQ